VTLIEYGDEHFGIPGHGRHKGTFGARADAHLEIAVHTHDNSGGIGGVLKRIGKGGRKDVSVVT